jgi:hypothetical protein
MSVKGGGGGWGEGLIGHVGVGDDKTYTLRAC